MNGHSELIKLFFSAEFVRMMSHQWQSRRPSIKKSTLSSRQTCVNILMTSFDKALWLIHLYILRTNLWDFFLKSPDFFDYIYLFIVYTGRHFGIVLLIGLNLFGMYLYWNIFNLYLIILTVLHHSYHLNNVISKHLCHYCVYVENILYTGIYRVLTWASYVEPVG